MKTGSDESVHQTPFWAEALNQGSEESLLLTPSWTDALTLRQPSRHI